MNLRERVNCAFLFDGMVTDAEYTVLVPEKHWKTFKAIKDGSYKGPSLEFECLESDIPISSANIVPKKDAAFVIFNTEEKALASRTENGWLIATTTGSRGSYQGMSVTFMPFNDDYEHTLPEAKMEFDEKGKLQCYVWSDPNSEDYTDKISFR